MKRLLPLLLILALAACAARGEWRKEGAGEAQFAVDAGDCRAYALAMGRARTARGRSAPEHLAAPSYRRCLYDRGWRPASPAQTASQPPRIVCSDTKVRGPGLAAAPPPGFAAEDAGTGAFGPVAHASCRLSGPDGASAMVSFQLISPGAFEMVPAPVPKRAELYSRGNAPSGGEEVRWSVYFTTDKEAVMGLSAYLDVSKTKRVHLSVARPLPPARSEPAPGLLLTGPQAASVEGLAAFWRTWLLRAAEAAKTGDEALRKEALRRLFKESEKE